MPSHNPKLYYLNPLFDLELGGYETASLVRPAAEMGFLFGLLGKAGDRVLVDANAPEDYWAYLEDIGFPHAEVCKDDAPCSGYSAVVWGWNSLSISRLLKMGVECHQPGVPIIRAVNSREFSCTLGSEKELGVPGALCCYSVEEVQFRLAGWKRMPLVIKPFFGNSGHSFIHKDNSDLSQLEARLLTDIILRQGGVVIEPWLDRLFDIPTRFHLTEEGRVQGVDHYQAHMQKSGAFFANLIETKDPDIGPWMPQLRRAVRLSAAALHKQGYFGPVGFDSFVWAGRDSVPRLAPAIEINARHPMSSVAYALRDNVGKDRVCYFRFISRRRHRLPANYDDVLGILGKRAYDKKMRTGIAVASPLRVHHGDRWTQPGRTAFFLAEESRNKLLKLDAWLRKAIRR